MTMGLCTQLMMMGGARFDTNSFAEALQERTETDRRDTKLIHALVEIRTERRDLQKDGFGSSQQRSFVYVVSI